MNAGAVPLCFALSFTFLLATHFTFLRLPYHWDELGQFIPAAHDLFTSGALVPRSTAPNVHPPLVMAYLAAAWKLFDFAIPVTRVAMLAVAAATMAAAFALARRLSGARAAWTTAALLAVSPPFVAQSMLAHLDLAATLWVLLAVLWFLEGRMLLCAAAATALVLTKETGLIVPVVLAVFARDTKRRLLILSPAVTALAVWLILLRSQTGHWLGNPEFAQYNLAEALRLGRVPLVLLRRIYQLGFADFHWAGVAVMALAGWRCGALADRPWRLVAAVIASYAVLHSLLGGAVLLRYILPALALFYVATAAALDALGPKPRRAALTVLLAGLVVCNWWKPPHRMFSFEDNLAVTDFIRLHQQAAAWLSDNLPQRKVTTAWPLTDALSNPLLGYVQRPLRVDAVEDFRSSSWDAVNASDLQVVAVYSRRWEPTRGWRAWLPLATLARLYFDYTPQLPNEELMRRFGLRRVARWDRRGQWVEILVR